MTAIAALTGPLPKAGVVVVALLAAWALLATEPRSRATAIAGALLLAPVLLLGEIWHSPQLHLVHHHPLYAAVGGVIGVAAVVAVALVILRRPAAAGRVGRDRTSVPGPDRGRRHDVEPARAPLPGGRRRGDCAHHRGVAR